MVALDVRYVVFLVAFPFFFLLSNNKRFGSP